MPKAKKKKTAPRTVSKKDDNGKLMSVLSYITIIGWIVALILNSSAKSKLASFHLRQALILVLAAMILPNIPGMIGWILGVIILVLWIMGIVYAFQGEMKAVPLIGRLAQNWFKSI